MNKTDVDNIENDPSSSTAFTLEVSIENGRITPAQRRMVANIIQRVCTGLTQSLDFAVPERFEIKLGKTSSATGTTILDIGAPNEE